MHVLFSKGIGDLVYLRLSVAKLCALILNLEKALPCLDEEWMDSLLIRNCV